MKLQFLGKTKVHVTFGTTRHKLYVSRYSTCDDVIQTVLAKEPVIDMKANTLAVFEQSGEIDRMLAGRTRVLKTIRAWGCEKSKFELLVKRKSDLTDFKKDALPIKDNAETWVDKLETKILTHANEKHITNMNNSEQLSEENRPKSLDKKAGKNALLSRYISDVFLYNKKPKKGFSKRKAGDGMENPPMESSRDSADGSSKFLEVCRNSWELDVDTDDESDIDSSCEDTYIIESEQSVEYSTDDDGCDKQTSYLDMAFVKSSAESDSDEGIDVTSVNSGDLNTAFVGEYVNVRPIFVNLRDLNTAFVGEFRSSCDISVNDNSKINSEEFLNQMKDNNSFIHRIFDKSEEKSEDDEMDSFMVSRIDIL